MQDPMHSAPSVRTAPWWNAVQGWLGRRPRDVREQYAKRKGRWDEFKLWQLGYKQQFGRSFTFFNCFGVGINIMTVFTVAETYSLTGLTYGGPVVMVWGWLAVGLLTTCIALSMGELLSAYPTAGGLYYWSWALAPAKHRGLFCWVTGFLNVLGQIAFVSGGELVFTQSVSTLVALHTAGPDGSPGYQLSDVQNMMVFLASVLSHTLLNVISQEFNAGCITFGALWQLVCTPAFILVMVLVAPSHQGSHWAWFEWTPNSDITGIYSPTYTVLMGLLLVSWTLTGFDVIANVSEETVDADVSASWAIPASTLCNTVLGVGLLVAMNYSVVSVDNLFNVDGPAGGSGMAQLMWDVFASRYGGGRGSIPLMYIPAVAIFFGVFSMYLSSVRMLFAFSRDGAMVGGHLWRELSGNGMPVKASCFMALLSILFGLPGCFYLMVFNTLSATAVVCMSLSFCIPIALKVWRGSRGFLEALYPLEPLTFNYTPALFAFTLIFAFVSWWAPKIGGVHWFKGPQPNVGIFDEDGKVSRFQSFINPAQYSQHMHTLMNTIPEALETLSSIGSPFTAGDPSVGKRSRRRTPNKQASKSHRQSTEVEQDAALMVYGERGRQGPAARSSMLFITDKGLDLQHFAAGDLHGLVDMDEEPLKPVRSQVTSNPTQLAAGTRASLQLAKRSEDAGLSSVSETNLVHSHGPPHPHSTHGSPFTRSTLYEVHELRAAPRMAGAAAASKEAGSGQVYLNAPASPLRSESSWAAMDPLVQPHASHSSHHGSASSRGQDRTSASGVPSPLVSSLAAIGRVMFGAGDVRGPRQRKPSVRQCQTFRIPTAAEAHLATASDFMQEIIAESWGRSSSARDSAAGSAATARHAGAGARQQGSIGQLGTSERHGNSAELFRLHTTELGFPTEPQSAPMPAGSQQVPASGGNAHARRASALSPQAAHYRPV